MNHLSFDEFFKALIVIERHTALADSGCLEWKSALTTMGYGKLTFHGKGYTAHRFAFEKLVESIQPGMWVLHRCDNPKCVNPEHLYQGTPIDNRADMLNRDRWKHPWANRTHCAKGHDYETGGYRIAADGSRVCKTCFREYQRAFRASKKGISQ